MRLFVAVEVPSEHDRGAAPPEHLTLAFLGEVPPERVPRVEEAVQEGVAVGAPFDLVLEGVGAFPSRERPRVVWVGATTGARELIALADRLAAALERAGFARERPAFVPHLTLFRVRSPAQHRRAVALLRGVEPPPAPRRVRVGELLLKESTLSAHGAVHRTVRSFSLAEAAVR